MTPLNNEGDRNLYLLGSHLGFNLLNDFTGWKYTYLGNFTALRPEVVAWRIQMLIEILDGRRVALDSQVKFGMATEVQARVMNEFFDRVGIWAVVNSDREKHAVDLEFAGARYPVEVFSTNDVRLELENLSRPTEQNSSLANERL